MAGATGPQTLACTLLRSVALTCRPPAAAQLYRADRPQKAVDLCMKYGQAWRAASLCGNRTWGDLLWTDDEGETRDRAGNPFWFMWKNTCWALSDRKSPPAHVSPHRIRTSARRVWVT